MLRKGPSTQRMPALLVGFLTGEGVSRDRAGMSLRLWEPRQGIKSTVNSFEFLLNIFFNARGGGMTARPPPPTLPRPVAELCLKRSNLPPPQHPLPFTGTCLHFRKFNSHPLPVVSPLKHTGWRTLELTATLAIPSAWTRVSRKLEMFSVRGK